MRSLFLMALLAALAARARALPAATEEVFSRFRDRVVQVRVLEAGSGAKASIGSGFFAGPDGLLLTNYHVVADLVHHPDRYRADVVRADKSTAPFTLLTFDVVNDLALGLAAAPGAPFFPLSARLPPQGTRLYSLGNPLDLGATIVEGTFNGFIEKSFYDKLHFTGSINPGMSGGPAILPDGRVVGVNVATAGEQVGFLVPAEKAAALLARPAARGRAPEPDFMALLREQLLANQERTMAKLTSAPFQTLPLEDRALPGAVADGLKCWADQPAPDRKPYAVVTAQCSTEEELFLSRSQRTGSIGYRHELLKNRSLNPLAFSRLAQEGFSRPLFESPTDEENVTNYACREDFVRAGEAAWKAAVCFRAYRRLPGLYDVALSAVRLPEKGRAVVTHLSLAGVSGETADRFIERYREALK